MAETNPTHIPGPEGQPYLLTIEQTANLLGMGRTLVHQKTKLFLDSGGAAVDGIPAVRIGRCQRVPRDRLLEWIDRGCMNEPSERSRDELATRRHKDVPAPPKGTKRDDAPPEQPPLFPAV
jgi:hypothetical protein